MNTEIICALIAGLASVITAMLGFSIKRSNKRAEAHAKLRERESLLSISMMDAILQLSVVTSNAVTGGHNNGNVERAREAAQKVAAEYEDFIRQTTAHELVR